MELKTKLDINDTVFFMRNNTVCKGVVKKIEYSIMENEATSRDSGWSPTISVILYSIRIDSSSTIKLEEKYIFSSKELLIKSL